MDLYPLLQSAGQQVTAVRTNKTTDRASGRITTTHTIEDVNAVEVPPTIALKELKSTYVDATTFCFVDTFNYQEMKLFPLTNQDYLVLNRVAYEIMDTSPIAEGQLVVLKRILGSPPFNVEQVVA